MSDLDFSSKSPPKPKSHAIHVPGNQPTVDLPPDNYNVPATNPPATNPPATIFYLTSKTPHIDSFSFYGPTSTFAALLPQIHSLTTSSPHAIRKLHLLRSSPTLHFDTLGFTDLIIKRERGSYTHLHIIREVNPPVFYLLPGPVYTVSAHGPLRHDMGTALRTVMGGRPGGWAENSRVVGSFVDVEPAKERAREVLGEMLEGELGVMVSEADEKGGKGRWVFWGMDATRLWEVRIRYEGGEEGMFWRMQEGGGESER
ncbi:hypothetical protein B0J11DRAFT_35236 [Dendryphion nanum]|uniref:Uncharacterized protein n=1 Tax=Dendryphion nanum TaxID=256645 RepID=A0A9P9EGF6_9PLEO|nr:hypothetical protein B0J11DRAFT_35236 [Dendryphion nanum]